MPDLFTKLMGAAEQQQQQLKQGEALLLNPETTQETKPSRNIKEKVAQIPAQKFEQTVEQVSKPVSSEAIEVLAFQLRLRKVNMRKVNTNLPEEWKDEIEEMAYKLHVGKYDLVMYMIGSFLGKVDPPKS